jgi:hypothetical protein
LADDAALRDARAFPEDDDFAVRDRACFGARAALPGFRVDAVFESFLPLPVIGFLLC